MCAPRGIEKRHGRLGTKLALVKQAMGFVTVGRSVVVERERVQVDATDGIVVARAAAEHGAHAEAGQILSS